MRARATRRVLSLVVLLHLFGVGIAAAPAKASTSPERYFFVTFAIKLTTTTAPPEVVFIAYVTDIHPAGNEEKIDRAIQYAIASKTNVNFRGFWTMSSMDTHYYDTYREASEASKSFYHDLRSAAGEAEYISIDLD